MKLGEMLVRDKRITPAQLEQAIAVQAREGGRLGTVLAEIGALDLDSLTVYLGLELGIPIASGATLERVKKTAVKLLTPKDAARFRCIPIVIQHRQLIAAIDDPHDLRALDELSQITSYRVVPRVAPEIRIYYYLERYYGVPRPSRFAVLGDAPRGSKQRPADPGLPAPPLPGLPPVSDAPTAPPTPVPTLRTRRPDAPPLPPRAQRELEIESDDLVEVLEADAAATAEQAPPLAASPAPVPATPPRPKTAPAYEPIDADTAVEAMRSAPDRAAIAHAVMAYASGVFDLALLMVVRDNMAFGWKSHGAEVGPDRVEAMLIPLEMPSIFQMALRAGQQYHGHAFPSTLHDYLFKVLGTRRPPFSLVSAISIGGRTVNLLYGHRTDPLELAEEVQRDIRRVCDAASEAYVRLIELSKGKARRAGSQPDAETEAAAQDSASAETDERAPTEPDYPADEAAPGNESTASSSSAEVFDEEPTQPFERASTAELAAGEEAGGSDDGADPAAAGADDDDAPTAEAAKPKRKRRRGKRKTGS